MGRSVSTPTNCIDVCYQDVSYIEDSWEWDDFIDNIKYSATEKFKSLTACDTWINREDHAILENDHCYIGVSEYCGLAAIWLVSKRDEHDNNSYYIDEQRMANLSDHWCYQVANKFNKLFGQYDKVGTFSNGESMFEKI